MIWAVIEHIDIISTEKKLHQQILRLTQGGAVIPDIKKFGWTDRHTNLFCLSLLHILILLYIAVDKFLHLDGIDGTIFAVRYLKKKESDINDEIK